jgi:beta-lactamase class D
MIKGYPWYIQFGFNNSFPEENLKIKNNYNKLKGKKVKDYDKNIFIDLEFNKFAKDNKELSIKSFIKSLCNHNIEKFNRVYQQIYLNLNLERLNNKEYYLEL